MKISRREMVAGAVATAAASISAPAIAQSSKPIVLVVGYVPGGLTDLMGRLFAAEFSKVLGRQVVVENRPGANGNIATTYAAKANANGEVLLFASGSQIVLNPNVYPSLQINPAEEFTHLGLVGEGDFVLATPTPLETKSMQDFVDLAKKNAGKFHYGTSGLGGYGHVLSELVKEKVGINVLPVHYRGSALLIPELISNQVQMAVDGPTLFRENIQAGKVKALMVIGASRSKLLPDVPTASEVGIAGLDGISQWWGVHAPKGLPASLAAEYESAVVKVISNPEYEAKLAANGISLRKFTASEFAKKIVGEKELFGNVTKAAKIVAD